MDTIPLSGGAVAAMGGPALAVSGVQLCQGWLILGHGGVRPVSPLPV